MIGIHGSGWELTLKLVSDMKNYFEWIGINTFQYFKQ